MKLFPYGHASHAQWRVAADNALSMLQSQLRDPQYASAPTLGLLYITDHYVTEAQALLDYVSAALPSVTDWSGTVGMGVCAGAVEYFDEPALVLLLLDVPSDQYRVFSGVAPLSLAGGPGFVAHTALLHADGHMLDVAGLIAEMAERTTSGYVFGGLSASRHANVQFAVCSDGNMAGQGHASGVFHSGLSGVAFDAQVALLSRMTQGCQPVGPVQTITAAQDNVVLQLDGAPALDVLLHTLQVSLTGDPQHAIESVRATLVGLMDASHNSADTPAHTGHFGFDTRVRHIIGLDGVRHGVALGDLIESGMRLSFCQRNATAARADLTRICAEIREELEPGDSADGVPAPASARRIVGALYVSCAGRGGPHFGGPSAELHILRHALGEVPLVGFFAGGEIAHHQLYSYSGVLTVFIGTAAGD
jgi:small ligand-binding sensory domain FIST